MTVKAWVHCFASSGCCYLFCRWVPASQGNNCRKQRKDVKIVAEGWHCWSWPWSPASDSQCQIRIWVPRGTARSTEIPEAKIVGAGNFPRLMKDFSILQKLQDKTGNSNCTGWGGTLLYLAWETPALTRCSYISSGCMSIRRLPHMRRDQKYWKCSLPVLLNERPAALAFKLSVLHSFPMAWKHCCLDCQQPWPLLFFCHLRFSMGVVFYEMWRQPFFTAICWETSVAAGHAPCPTGHGLLATRFRSCKAMERAQVP